MQLVQEVRGDQSRQATGLFKGIAYQIWQTVLVWISLKEEDILVVEGAEDFDHIGPDGALLNQVKAVSQPISLRSESASSALRNFWTVRQKNPRRPLSLQFISTSGFATEAGDPFGGATSGLALWNQEAQTPTGGSAALLRFLTTDSTVAERLSEPFPSGIPSLFSYLQGLSPEAFQVEFVARIRWLLNQPDVDVVREMVRVSLHAYGEDKGLLPRDSERALTVLFEHVAFIGFQQRRTLTRAEFRECFDNSVRVSIPISQLTHWQAGVSGMARPDETNRWDVISPLTQTLLPDLPQPCAPRSQLVESIAVCVRAHGFVAIHAGTGKGKSTLAKLAALRLGGDWIWISFGDLETAQSSAELRLVTRRATSGPVALLLDNVNPRSGPRPEFLRSLAVLCRLVVANKGRLMLTTQWRLDTVFLRQSCVPEATLISVPVFEPEEIVELCLQAGCPDENRARSWTAIISSQTGRHPQLVHARITSVLRRGWPAPSLPDITGTPEDIAEERKLTRQLLVGLDDREIELLYRLSLGFEPFRRDQAIAVGEIEPAVSRPGDTFDSLRGPWVESVGGGYYRLSSLLAGAAEENWSSSQVLAMRKHYASAVIRAGDRTLLEASEVLHQSVRTKDPGLAASVLAELHLAPPGSRGAFPTWLSWMLLVPDVEAIFGSNPFVCHLFVAVQFRVAAVSGGALAITFAERFSRQAMKPVHPDIDTPLQIGAAGDILLQVTVLVKPALLIDCWFKAIQEIPQNEMLAGVTAAVDTQHQEIRRLFPRLQPAEVLFGFVLARRGGHKYFRQFISAVENLTPERRATVVSMIKANVVTLASFVDDAWTSELAEETRNWAEVIVVLEEGFEAGIRWGIPELSMSAARGVAAIQDEYLGRPDDALKRLSNAAAVLGQDGLLLRYQRGMIHYRHHDYDQAYQTWVSGLDEWPTGREEEVIYATFAFSNCGAAAGYLKRWSEAAVIFDRGRELAAKAGRQQDALEFKVDGGCAMWKAGQRQSAVGTLSECLVELEKLSKTADSVDFHTLWKLTEHIVRWCATDAGAPSQKKMADPRPGICSEAKPKEQHDLLKGVVRGPALLAWYALAEAELYAGTGRGVFSATMARSDVDAYPGLRPMIAYLRARRALVDDEYQEIPPLTELAAAAFVSINLANADERLLLEASSAPSGQMNPGVDSNSLVDESLLCTLLWVTAKKISWASVLNDWREVAPRMRDPAHLLRAVELVARLSETPPIEVYAETKKPDSSRFSQVVAGLCLAIHPDSGPSFRYVGLCALVLDAGFANNMMLSHVALASLTRDVLLQAISTPFELLAPRLTVPAIRAACESGKEGLALAATILLTACEAVGVAKSQNIQEDLKRLASR